LSLRLRIRKILFFVLTLMVISCGSSDERDYRRGISRVEEKDFKAALIYFHQSILRNPESKYAILAAREGAKVAFLDLKDFKKAVEFYKYIVMAAKDSEERLNSQRQIANIFFDNLSDYENAILEINKLISMISDNEEKTKYRVNLARAYYYTNNFTQAESEAQNIIKMGGNEETLFQMMVLVGNIYLAKKDITKASEIFHDILVKYPQKAVKENVASTLAVAYEEMKDYKNAIQVLQAMKPYYPMPEYIDLRIKRLLESQKSQPGAKGLRRK
jgi:tetratricopeptide (TPR) repeat protein